MNRHGYVIGSGGEGRGPGTPRLEPRRSHRRARVLHAQARAVSATPFTTLDRSRAPRAVAPDGSDVRVLLGVAGGGLAEFELAAGAVSTAVTHRTVEEIWYVLTVPLGAHFQFRALGNEPLTVLGATMPPWPGEGEAIAVTGPYPLSALTRTPSTILRLATRNTISSGSALSAAPAMMGPYDSAA